jgi:large subunit ribosomal protein L10
MSVVRESKQKEVEELKKLIDEYAAFGIIDTYKLPSKQLQEIRKKIRGAAMIKMCKKSVLTHALKESNKKNIEELEKIIPLQPAIVFSKTEAFRFYGMIDKMKSKTSAKTGDVAPEDIKVFSGPTSLMAGPAISEFTKAGIPAGVEEGKIAIKKDVVVAKKGAVISKDLANVLRKLNVQPILVGLNIVVIYENGMLYKKDALSLVGEGYLNKLKGAFNQALNLSVFICYPTKENVDRLLAKAYNHAKALENRIGGAK